MLGINGDKIYYVYQENDGTYTTCAYNAKTDKSSKIIMGMSAKSIIAGDGLYYKYVADGNMTSLSRSNFASTFPSSPVSKTLSQELINELTGLDIHKDKKLGEVEGSLLYQKENPTSKKDNGLTLSDLRGYDYNDSRWDELLDQLDYESEDIANVLTYALYQTAKVEAIGKVETNDNDGTVGLTANWGGNKQLAESMGSKTSEVTSCAYPCAPIQAATFNREVMKRMGEMISEESLTNNISGWYAPGLNIHRSPYGGRNYEYFSEDTF